MNNEITTEKAEEKNQFETLVDPKEFGIELANETRVPIIQILDFFEKEETEILTAEITPEIAQRAKDLAKRYVKIRTTIDAFHKMGKAEYLEKGRRVDKWKNDNTKIVQDKESKLLPIVEHYQRIEQERIKSLTAERSETLTKYGIDPVTVPTIAIMSDEMWATYLTGVKINFEEKEKVRIASELAQKEKERLEEEERQKTRLENERLKKEIEEKSKIRSARSLQLKPYIIFIRDYNALIESEETEYQSQLSEIKKGAEQHWENEKQEQAKKIVELAEQERERAKQQAEKIKLENELKQKKEAEEKAIRDQQEKEENDAKKADSERLVDLVSQLESIKTNQHFKFKSKKNQKMFTEVCILIDKLIIHVKK